MSAAMMVFTPVSTLASKIRSTNARSWSYSAPSGPSSDCSRLLAGSSPRCSGVLDFGEHRPVIGGEEVVGAKST